MIRRILEIPFYLWIIIAGGLGYKDYSDWKSNSYEPLLAQIETDKRTLANLKAQETKIDEFKRRRQEKLTQLQELAEKFRATADRLPRTANIPDLLKSLADLSDRSGLEFSRFKPQTVRMDQFLTITPLEVNLKGTYPQIMTFLDSAANLTRIVSAEKLTLDQAVQRGPVSQVSAVANLVTYHIDSASIEGAVNATATPAAKPEAKGK